MTGADTWDADRDVVGLTNGKLLEVRGGELIERDRTHADRITRTLAARPTADWQSGAWADHLLGLFPSDDVSTIAYLQRLVGAALIGRGGDEHVIVLAKGRSGTGKSTTFTAIRRAAGGYGASVDPLAISSTRGMPMHSQNRMAFRGSRFAVSAELADGAVLDAGFVKSLSGGDAVKAREMRQNDLTFVFHGLLVIHTNSVPGLLAPDDGLRRRLRVVPFDQVRETKDTQFASRIDLGDVIGWALDGARAYLADGGLRETPANVEACGDEYHETADPLSEFVARHLRIDPGEQALGPDVYAAYQAHCAATGVAHPVNARTLNRRLIDGFGLKRDRRGGHIWLLGCCVQQDEQDV